MVYSLAASFNMRAYVRCNLAIKMPSTQYSSQSTINLLQKFKSFKPQIFTFNPQPNYMQKLPTANTTTEQISNTFSNSYQL